MSPEPRSAVLEESPLSHGFGFLAVKAFAGSTRITNEQLAPLGLRVRSYSVLALACGDHPLTQRDLAEHLALDPSQIVALVDELERDDLVRREIDKADRRSRVVRATRLGHSRFVEARAAATTAEDEALASLDADERAELLRILRKIVFA